MKVWLNPREHSDLNKPTAACFSFSLTFPRRRVSPWQRPNTFSPFGKRCTCIHDSRLAGSSPSWLPHTETQGNTMDTDINVDALHQKRLHEIFFGTPFGPAFSLERRDQWSDLYKIVCNIGHIAKEQARSGGGWMETTGHGIKRGGGGHHHHHHHHPAQSHAHAHRHKQLTHHHASLRTGHPSNGAGRSGGLSGSLHPIYKLQIALLMRNGGGVGNNVTSASHSHDWYYKFRPQHVIHDEVCMVLQTRAFRLIDNTNMDIQEISLELYRPHVQDLVLVREIAFGPDCEPTARGVSLWFNIDEKDVTLCTSQQSKRFRFKRGVNKKEDEKQSTKSSVFDSLDSFTMVRPRDQEAYKLAGDMMEHRLNVLRMERISNMRERFEALQQMEEQKKALQQRFEELKASWLAWAWPVNHGREKVTKNTPVPPVDGNYEFKENVSGSDSEHGYDEDDDDGGQQSAKIGSATRNLWRSLVLTDFSNLETPKSGFQVISPSSKVNKSGWRLPVFEKLAGGTPVAPDYTPLPHILDNSSTQNKADMSTSSTSSSQEERCWKALLLQPQSDKEINEWGLVREHFEKSRSKKVLSIIQQKS